MSEYEDGDNAAASAELNIQQLAKLANSPRGISTETLAQIAIAKANLAIAAYLKMLCKLIEAK